MSLLDFAVTAHAGRMSKLEPGDRLDEFGTARQCTAAQCSAVLSRYNPASTCSVHRGWRNEPQTRRRSA